MTVNPSVADTATHLSHDEAYAIAERCLPGAGLGGYSLPEEVRFVIREGQGSRLRDLRDREYIDYVGGAGALILGHAHPAVTRAVVEQAPKGLHQFGTLSEPAVHLAAELVEAIPCAEKIIYTSTGSEATFYALRLARAFTGRNKILKFEGAYHGNHDYSVFATFPKAPSNYPQGIPDSGGVPEVLQSQVLISPYNDLEAVSQLVAEHGKDLAAIIVEPVQRITFPRPGFLEGLRKLCTENGIVLIFDEVVTGFRLGWDSGQGYFGVTPDLASFGKIVGGGGPLGCVAGNAEIIDLASPQLKGQSNYAYINGTLHGNPVAAAAGLATLAELRKPGFYQRLHQKADDLCRECQAVLTRHGLPAIATGAGSLWQILFLDQPPVSQGDILRADMNRSRALDLQCLRDGLYVLPGVRRFISAVHDDGDLQETLRILDGACQRI